MVNFDSIVNQVRCELLSELYKTSGSVICSSLSFAIWTRNHHVCYQCLLNWQPLGTSNPENKVHGANMGPTWVLSAPDGPHIGPMNLGIREVGFPYSRRVFIFTVGCHLYIRDWQYLVKCFIPKLSLSRFFGELQPITAILLQRITPRMMAIVAKMWPRPKEFSLNITVEVAEVCSLSYAAEPGHCVKIYHDCITYIQR